MERKNEPYTYAEAIREARDDLIISQAELARRLGVSVSTVCKWEQGSRTPRGLYKAKVDRFLAKWGVTIPWRRKRMSRRGSK